MSTHPGSGWTQAVSKTRIVAFAIVFAAVGLVLLFATHAIIPAASSTEAENGSYASGASVATDATASGGRAVKFGASSSAGGGSGGSSSPTDFGPSGAASPSGSSYGTHALAQWATAIDNRASKPATWVAWGDSVTEGQGSSTVAGRWTNQTLNGLRTKYPVSGVTGGFGYMPAFYGTYGPDSQWSTDPTLNGNASQNVAVDDGNDGQQFGNGAGLGMLTVTLRSGGSDTFRITGTSIDILYNYGSGTFSYSVDSGGATNVSAGGGSGATGSKHVAFSSSGSHTVTISGVSGSVILEGIMTYNGDENKGIRLYNGAQSGTTSGDFAAQAANMAAIVANVKADLVTIEIGGNDYNRQSGPPSQTAANIKTMVNDIRSAGNAVGHVPSIVIVIVYPISGGNDSFGYNDAAYNAAIKSVATADSSLGFLDFTSFGATAGQPNSLLSSYDNSHPSNAGQTRLATMVESYLEIK